MTYGADAITQPIEIFPLDDGEAGACYVTAEEAVCKFKDGRATFLLSAEGWRKLRIERVHAKWRQHGAAAARSP